MSIRPRFTVQSSNVASLETPPFVDDVPNKTCLIYTGCSPIVNGCRSKIDISIHIMSAWNAEVSSKVRFLWLKSHNYFQSITQLYPCYTAIFPETSWKSMKITHFTARSVGFSDHGRRTLALGRVVQACTAMGLGHKGPTHRQADAELAHDLPQQWAGPRPGLRHGKKHGNISWNLGPI